MTELVYANYKITEGHKELLKTLASYHGLRIGRMLEELATNEALSVLGPLHITENGSGEIPVRLGAAQMAVAIEEFVYEGDAEALKVLDKLKTMRKRPGKHLRKRKALFDVTK